MQLKKTDLKGLLSFLPSITLWLCVIIFFLMLRMPDSQGKNSTSEADFGANIMPSLGLTIEGGRNESGKLTLLSGNAVNFGTINFLHPENISNGDAYLVGDIFRLEAVLNIAVMFSGASTARLEISRLDVSANPFNQTYFSLSTSRSGSLTVIQKLPSAEELKTFDKPGSLQMRLVCDVTSKQSGTLRDRFRITGTTRP